MDVPDHVAGQPLPAQLGREGDMESHAQATRLARRPVRVLRGGLEGDALHVQLVADQPLETLQRMQGRFLAPHAQLCERLADPVPRLGAQPERRGHQLLRHRHVLSQLGIDQRFLRFGIGAVVHAARMLADGVTGDDEVLVQALGEEGDDRR